MGLRYIDYSRNSPLSSQVFLPEEVWHEKLPNPFDFWRGFPPWATGGKRQWLANADGQKGLPPVGSNLWLADGRSTKSDFLFDRRGCVDHVSGQ